MKKKENYIVGCSFRINLNTVLFIRAAFCVVRTDSDYSGFVANPKDSKKHLLNVNPRILQLRVKGRITFHSIILQISTWLTVHPLKVDAVHDQADPDQVPGERRSLCPQILKVNMLVVCLFGSTIVGSVQWSKLNTTQHNRDDK